MGKISKHPRYDDPTAFSKRFPRIERLQGNATLMSRIAEEQSYKMGAIRVGLTLPSEGIPGYFMSVHGRVAYPDWDAVVWLRYNLIPDAAVMSLLLPNLNAYINQDDTHHKFVFTLEQKGWALDPIPTCTNCGKALVIAEHLLTPIPLTVTQRAFVCPMEGLQYTIDMVTWNEQNGNGFLGNRP